MATIKIEHLSITGSELFSDSESYLDQLSESDTLSIQGGTSYPWPPRTTTFTGPIRTTGTIDIRPVRTIAELANVAYALP
ncbi:MAG: hypothetical protein ACFKPT_22905 [Gloeotrichia echinulata GP01]